MKLPEENLKPTNHFIMICTNENAWHAIKLRLQKAMEKNKILLT